MAPVADAQKDVLIALGANLASAHGTPAQTLMAAVAELRAAPLSRIQTSRIYRTPAFPAGSGPDFANMVMRGQTSMTAQDILSLLHETEHRMGRERTTRWSARVLDLDLLGLGECILPSTVGWQVWADMDIRMQRKCAPSEIILPHPRMAERAFVLVPLAEVAPHWVHPVTGLSAKQMVSKLAPSQRSQIWPMDTPDI